MIPAQHVAENLKLEAADAYVDLMELYLVPSGQVYFKNSDTVTWQTKTYEGLAFKMSGVSKAADEQESRPTLTIVNPEALFSIAVEAGQLERATVIQRRIRRSDLDANNNVAQVRTWFVTRVAQLSDEMIAVELRDLTDGPNFLVPARMFLPPEWPVVSLS